MDAVKAVEAADCFGPILLQLGDDSRLAHRLRPPRTPVHELRASRAGTVRLPLRCPKRQRSTAMQTILVFRTDLGWHVRLKDLFGP